MERVFQTVFRKVSERWRGVILIRAQRADALEGAMEESETQNLGGLCGIVHSVKAAQEQEPGAGAGASEHVIKRLSLEGMTDWRRCWRCWLRSGTQSVAASRLATG